MRCENCGHELEGQAKFCPNCGAPVEPDTWQPTDPTGGNRKKRKNRKKGHVLLVVLLVLCALVLAAIIGVLLYTGTDSYQISRKLSLGDRYLEEKDYERAVAAYEDAVKIDSKSVDAYIGLAEAQSDYAQDLTQKAEKAQENAEEEEYVRYITQARTEITSSEENYNKVIVLIQEQDAEISGDRRQTLEDKAESVQKQNVETHEKAYSMPDTIGSNSDDNGESGEEQDKEPMYQAYLDILEDRETDILLYEGWTADDYYDSDYPARRKEITLYDLDGDGMEELIFIDGERTTENSYGQGYLYIYTYKEGEAVEAWRGMARTNAGGGSSIIIAACSDSGSFMIINSYADEFQYVYVKYCSLEDGTVDVDSWRLLGIEYDYDADDDGEIRGVVGEGEGIIDELDTLGSQVSEYVSLDTVEQARQEVQEQIGQVLLRDYRCDSSHSVYDSDYGPNIQFSGEPADAMNLEEAREYLRDLIEQYGGSVSETGETGETSEVRKTVSNVSDGYYDTICAAKGSRSNSDEYVNSISFDGNSIIIDGAFLYTSTSDMESGGGDVPTGEGIYIFPVGEDALLSSPMGDGALTYTPEEYVDFLQSNDGAEVYFEVQDGVVTYANAVPEDYEDYDDDYYY